MATIFYIRESSKQGRITSSREVCIVDLSSLYGSTPSNYIYMKDADSPEIITGQGPAASGSDPAHVIVKIESSEVRKETFPVEGYYKVRDVKP
jgi:hypothetical protein